MIAACPKCQTRYRVQPEQVGADGARLRCSHCSAVFRVRLPLQASPASAQRGEAERSHQDASAAAATPPPRERSHQDASAAAATPPPPERSLEAPPAAAAPPPPPLERSHRDASRIAAAPPPALTAPDPTEPGPVFDRERLVVVAHSDAETCKSVASALEGWGLQTLVAHDGVEAILSIQRALPRVVVIDAALPKMYGFQVCEVVKRNESLRETRVVLVGAIHKDDRYRRAPRELYGADVYVEPPDLPDALHGILTGFGVELRQPDGSSAGDPPARRQARYGHVARGGQPAATDLALLETGSASREAAVGPAGDDSLAPRIPSPAVDPGRPTARSAPAPRPAAVSSVDEGADPDPLVAERAKAERLARIIVSDIALYNPEKFAAATRSGVDALAAMRDELEEGRALFRERIDARVRAERDHLAEELVRAAKARSGP